VACAPALCLPWSTGYSTLLLAPQQTRRYLERVPTIVRDWVRRCTGGTGIDGRPCKKEYMGRIGREEAETEGVDGGLSSLFFLLCRPVASTLRTPCLGGWRCLKPAYCEGQMPVGGGREKRRSVPPPWFCCEGRRCRRLHHRHSFSTGVQSPAVGTSEPPFSFMRHEHSDVTIPDNSNKLRCSPCCPLLGVRATSPARAIALIYTTKQSKIVSAAARYGKSDWIWQEEASTEQNFVVCNSVSFKMFEQEVSWPADFAKQGETRVSAL